MKSNRVGVFNFDKNIPLEQQSKCPSCENELKTACVFVSEKSVMRMKYGICTHCGYMGYIDRPSKQWMIDFYSNDWDKAFPRTEEQIKNGTILPGKGIKPDRFITASLLSKINFDKNKPFVEMGSGYGEVLKYFKEQGLIKRSVKLGMKEIEHYLMKWGYWKKDDYKDGIRSGTFMKPDDEQYDSFLYFLKEIYHYNLC